MEETYQRPYTVTQLTREIKQILETSYPKVFLEGEVSNFKPASSGHWYFSLKDEESIIQAVMFRSAQKGIMPKDGQVFRIRGNLAIYSKRGSYQLICKYIEASGEGNILYMLEQRKRQLAAEGLFDLNHKRTLPFFPRRILVLSSETGAAVQDIIRIIKRRASWLNLCIVNIPVQGEEAAQQIVRRLKAVESLGDVIILGRGGGSLEDLLPFSDEEVIRAIHDCKTPVISAVGHEIDWTLSDLVADLRAPTPSAAAEMVCSTSEELKLRILTSGRVIIQSFNAIRQRLRIALKPFHRDILDQSFHNCIRPNRLALDDAREGIVEGMRLHLHSIHQRLELLRREFAACDPVIVLKRGYAIIKNKEGSIIRNVEAAGNEKELDIQFHNGLISVAPIIGKDSR